MNYQYGDIIREKETNRIAKIEYGGLHSHVYCISFAENERYQINDADLQRKFERVNPICPRCGHILVESDLPEYTFLCKNCDENFYKMEVTQYIQQN